MNEILKFLEKTEITTRNWLQNQGRMEEKKGVKKGGKKRGGVLLLLFLLFFNKCM
jgi:hypothetical protein